ncbi:MAG: deaminase [Candidatus Shapirobacteria bacterium]|jgi:deoxycytidylate deaminase
MAISYPYLPPGRLIEYVPANHPFMLAATAQKNSKSCVKQPTGAIVVKDEQIIGRGSNAGISVKVCPRVQQHYPTGQGYHLCREICHQEGHAEVMAIQNALKTHHDPTGSDLYLDGHWWCCQNCWAHIIKHNILHVYLRDDSYQIYRR